MTIHVDENNDLPEQEHEDRGEHGGENPHSLACLTTYAPSVVLLCGHLYGQLGLLGQRVQDLEERLDRLGTAVEQQYRRDGEHMAILAACQRDTASFLNRELERNALYPAVEAVVGLAEELLHLQDCARQFLQEDGGGDGADRLQQEIDICCTVAREKLANLDVQRITPSEVEQPDLKTHSLCGYVETMDENLHGRISKLVTPGIAYRGRVLRQARVTVFRMKTSANQEQRKGTT
jgi:molecular chaperone GrpE (heat shock protein)